MKQLIYITLLGLAACGQPANEQPEVSIPASGPPDLTGTYQLETTLETDAAKTIDSSFVEFRSDTLLAYYYFGSFAYSDAVVPEMGIAFARWHFENDTLYAHSGSINDSIYTDMLLDADAEFQFLSTESQLMELRIDWRYHVAATTSGEMTLSNASGQTLLTR